MLIRTVMIYHTGYFFAPCNTYCRLKYRLHANPVCKAFLTPLKLAEITHLAFTVEWQERSLLSEDILHCTDDPQCILTGLLMEAVKACVADPKAQHQGDDLWTLCAKTHVHTEVTQKHYSCIWTVLIQSQCISFFSSFLFPFLPICFKLFFKSLHSKLPRDTWRWIHSPVSPTPSLPRQSTYSQASINSKCFLLHFANLHKEWQRR